MRPLGHKGFSLPELMIALGIAAGITLITMKIIEDQKSNEAYLKSRTEVQKAVSLLKTSLNDLENCRSVFAGKTLSTAGVNITSPLQIPLKTAPGAFKEILRPATTYSGFQTGTIRLSSPAGAAPGSAQIEVQFKIKNRKMSFWSDTSKDMSFVEKITLLVRTNTSNVITDCGSVVSETNLVAKQKFCQSLGAAAQWNATLAKCEFRDMRCPYGQVLMKLDSFGQIVCRNIQDVIDLNLLFDPLRCTNTGRYQIQAINGKLRIICL